MRESKYINETTFTHRKEFGQFFTPPLVARLMAQWVMKDVPRLIAEGRRAADEALDAAHRDGRLMAAA